MQQGTKQPSRHVGAVSGVFIGGSVDHTREEEKAGLGEMGYHGSLISSKHGARVRIHVVYTNITKKFRKFLMNTGKAAGKNE